MKMSPRKHHLALSSSLCLLLLTSSTSAQLACISPSASTTSTLQPGTPLSLKFTNKQPTTLGSALLSDISANLICTSTRDSVLTLASKLEQGKSFSATISQEEAASALKACPVNSFLVQYKESSLLSTNTENCAGSFSIQLEHQQPEQPAIALPPISLPLPDVPTKTTTAVEATATGSPSTTPTIVEPQPTVTAPNPTTTATTIVPSASTTAGVVPPVVPPNSTTSTHPSGTTTTPPLKNPLPAATTTTTHPPKSGGDHNGGGGEDLQPSSPPTNPIASSDMQQSTGPGPSTASIAGMSVGVVAGIFVILGAMLVWRRRSQRRADFDLFFTDTLAAASGLQPRGSGSGAGATTMTSSAEQPIYARSAPKDEKYGMSGNINNTSSNNHAAPVSRKASLNVPRRSRSHTSTHARHPNSKSPIPSSSAPAPPMPTHPYPVAGNGGQDSSYYQQDSYYNSQYHQQHQQHQQPEYHTQQQHKQHHAPPQRKPSYKLPRQHPAFDYDDYSY